MSFDLSKLPIEKLTIKDMAEQINKQTLDKLKKEQKTNKDKLAFINKYLSEALESLKNTENQTIDYSELYKDLTEEQLRVFNVFENVKELSTHCLFSKEEINQHFEAEKTKLFDEDIAPTEKFTVYSIQSNNYDYWNEPVESILDFDTLLEAKQYYHKHKLDYLEKMNCLVKKIIETENKEYLEQEDNFCILLEQEDFNGITSENNVRFEGLYKKGDTYFLIEEIYEYNQPFLTVKILNSFEQVAVKKYYDFDKNESFSINGGIS